MVGACKPRHRASEFRAFLDQVEASVPTDLDVHLVLDNAATHKTSLVHDWLLKRPRWHLHVTPTVKPQDPARGRPRHGDHKPGRVLSIVSC